MQGISTFSILIWIPQTQSVGPFVLHNKLCHNATTTFTKSNTI